MKDPDTIEVDKKMSAGTLLVVSLEEDSVPVDSIELHESLRGRDIDQSCLGHG